MSSFTFVVIIADASVTAYAKRLLAKALIAVILFSKPPLGGRCSSLSISMASSGPNLNQAG